MTINRREFDEIVVEIAMASALSEKSVSSGMQAIFEGSASTTTSPFNRFIIKIFKLAIDKHQNSENRGTLNAMEYVSNPALIQKDKKGFLKAIRQSIFDELKSEREVYDLLAPLREKPEEVDQFLEYSENLYNRKVFPDEEFDAEDRWTEGEFAKHFGFEPNTYRDIREANTYSIDIPKNLHSVNINRTLAQNVFGLIKVVQIWFVVDDQDADDIEEDFAPLPERELSARDALFAIKSDIGDHIACCFIDYIPQFFPEVWQELLQGKHPEIREQLKSPDGKIHDEELNRIDYCEDAWAKIHCGNDYY